MNKIKSNSSGNQTITKFIEIKNSFLLTDSPVKAQVSIKGMFYPKK